MRFWSDFWTIFFFTAVTVLVLMDVTAVITGHHDGVGDKYTFTHWLIMHVGLSVIGAFIGYLIAHFLIVHHNG